MMVVMTPAASQAEIDAVVRRLEAAGVHAAVMPGELTTAIGAIGDPEGVRSLALEGMAGVDQVIPISRPYKLASSELSHHEPTIVSVDGRSVGGSETFCLIAGPCTVESREQTLAVARAVKQAGASMLRGGAFKPRTSPYSFQGLGAARARGAAPRRARRPACRWSARLTDAAHAEAMAAVVDVIQVGARNMQNYGLLEVVGKLGKPVLLKRGLSSTVDELLMAADYVLKEGNGDVILCERGIRTFETATRFTLDLGAVPYAEAAHASAGHRGPLARLGRSPPRGAALDGRAAAVGADGIIVEVAMDPEAALCDGPQQLFASDFGRFAQAVAGHASLVGRRLA